MKSPSWRTTFYTILISILIGGVSGVLGTAWTSSYLSDYAVQLSKLTAPLRLSQERPRNFPSSYKEALEKITQSSLSGVADIYQGKPGVFGFDTSDRLRAGLVLTSDGWLAVYAPPSGPVSLKGASARVRGQTYQIVESVYDEVARVVFAKVEAGGLPVVAFGSGRGTQVGEQAFLATESYSFVPTSIQTHSWPGTASVSSDEPNRRLVIDREATTGDILFNLNGEAIGMAGVDGRILPIEAIQPALRSLLQEKKIARSALGVSYIDVAHGVNISTELVGSFRHGALLYGPVSVPRLSPARKAGVLQGDLLLSVNGEAIDSTRGLDELIEQYRPGDRVQILLDRKGEQMTVEVELGERGK